MTPKPNPTPSILAAGGVVKRRKARHTEFLVVHRPRYDDWSLPKGKLDPDERFFTAAAREIEEETGSRARKLTKLGSIAYSSLGGKPKVVRYWLFEHEGGKFKPNSEVDEVRWVRAADALQLLTYPRDRNVFAWGATLADSPRAGKVHLVRHAKAGSRAAWKKDDRVRPLSKPGRSQAMQIAATLAATPVQRILSSSYARCVQTLEPLAASISEKVRDEATLAEGASTGDLVDRLSQLEGTASVLCSHGAEISALIAAAAARGALVEPGAGIETDKGGIWELELAAGIVTGARYRGVPG